MACPPISTTTMLVLENSVDRGAPSPTIQLEVFDQYGLLATETK
jgi:hypothetical protein